LLFNWSISLPCNMVLKKAGDSLLCSMCHKHPNYFSLLMGWMGIIPPPVQCHHRLSMTDDSKKQNLSSSLTDDSKNAQAPLALTESHLAPLASSSQSPEAIKQLLDSGLPSLLVRSLASFCFSHISYSESIAPSIDNSQDKLRRHHVAQRCNKMPVTADLVAPVLRFLTEVGNSHVMKDWLGGPEVNPLWTALLFLLCHSGSAAGGHNLGAQQSSTKPASQSSAATTGLTTPQRTAIENATVAFFLQCISCHPNNQKLMAQLYKGRINASSHVLQHPMDGEGHKFHTLHWSVSTTLPDAPDRVSVFEILVLIFRYERKKKASRQKAICVNRVRNLSVSQLIQLENFAAGVICFSELPSDWTLEYAVDLITERRFRRMSRHLDNARSALMRLTKIISQNTYSSSASEERRVVQDKPVEVSQGPRLQDVKPNELTSRPQMQESKHMLIARLKQQSRKLVNIAKTPSIQGEEFGDLISTQWHQGRAPMDSNLEPGQDNQITVSSAEWKGGILSRPNKQLESGDVLSMGSDQEPKPAVRKPTELISKVQFKDTPSSELAPEPVVAHVNAQGVQYGPQVSSVKPCPMTPEPQVHQVKALEPMVEPPLQDVTTMVLSSDPQSGSTNSVQGTPRSECQREPCTGSDLRLQPQGARPKELKPSTQGRGVRSPELTVRSKVQGEKSREFHLESDLQVKTSLLAVGLQEKKFNCTSVLHPQGIRTVKLNKKPQVKSVRFSQWTPAPKFQGVTFLESNCGPPSPGVRATEEKTSIQLGGWKTPEMALGPTPQGKKSENLNLGPQELYLKTSELSPGPQPHKGENVPSTSEPQSQCVKSVALHHGPQLENTKSDPMIPLSDCQDRSSPGLSCGLQPQEGKPLGSSPGTQPRAVTPSPVKQQSQSSEEKSGAGSQRSQSLNDVELKCGKSSELALQTKPRAGTSENGSGPQWQCAKCSDLSPETASQNMNYTKLSPSSQLKGKPFTELAVGTQTRGVKLDCKPGPQWQGVKSNSFLRTKPQEMEMEDSESGPKLQDLKPSEMVMDIKVHDVMSVDFGSGPHSQGITSEVISGKRDPGMKSIDIKPRSKLQGQKHAFTPTKMVLGTKSVELDSGSRVQDLKYPELIMSMKLLGVNSMGQHVTTIKSSEVVTQVESQGVNAVDLNSGPQTQSKKSHVEDVDSCTSDANSQHINSSGCKSGTYLQVKNSAACIPELDLQCIKSVFNPGSHLHGTNPSACIIGPKLQCAASTRCIHEPNWQDVDSSICTPVPSSQRMNSPVCTQGPSPQCMNSPVCTQGPSPQCMNSPVCTPGPSPQSVNSSECHSEAHLQGVNQWASILGPHIPCVDPTGCNPKSYLQGMNPSTCTPGQNPQCEHSNRCNLEPLLGMNPGTTVSTPHIMCISSAQCNTKTCLQDMDSSACTQRRDSQSLSSTRYNPGPHFKALKRRGMKFSASNPGTGIQREMPIIVNQGQHVQDLKLDLTPGLNIRGVAPVGSNPGPQVPRVGVSELNPGLKSQCLNPVKLSSGPQVQNGKSFECSPGSEPQCPKSALLNSGPPSQGGTSSHSLVGAEFQEIPGRKDHLGPRQQTAQPMFTLRPPSNGVKPVGVLPTPLPEDRMSPESSKQPLLCFTNSVKLTPGCDLQDLRNKEFSPEPCFEKVTSVKVKPGSPAQSLNPLEFTPFHRSQHAKSSFAPKPCLQGTKPVQLRLGSQQLSMDCQQFPFGEKPTSDPDSKSSELTPQKRYRSPETLNLSRCMHSRSVPLTGSAMPGGARALAMKNFGSRTSDSHHSLKASCLPQAEMDISDQLHLLKDLQLQTAAKLLESQVPHNVPPPLESGLVLQYPICLQCGRCSAFKSCCKTECAFGPLISVYPQICFFRTLEGRAKMQVDLGFKLGIGERPLVGRCQRRSRAAARKHTTRQRKANTYRPASKSPTTPRDFQSPSSQAPASVQLQWGSHGVVGKMDANDSEHYEFCPRKDKTRAKGSLKKTYRVKYLLKKMKRDFILSLL
ncbi:hypothetical protein STEG23_020873, partial [Scotinomys teguina]